MANLPTSSPLSQDTYLLDQTENSYWSEVTLQDLENKSSWDQCFDHHWDSEHPLGDLSMTMGTTVTDAPVLAENIIPATNTVTTTDAGGIAAREYLFEGFVTRKRTKRTFCKPSSLTQEVISRYFHLPMKQAAKELRIGEAPLKKACRRLGINRWPYRKLLSWGRLAGDVQQFDKLQDSTERVKTVKDLEDKMERLIREPNLELDHKTFKLRESSYKKRKYYNSMYLAPTSCASSSSVPPVTTGFGPRVEEEEEDDVIKALLDDQCPPNNMFGH